MMFWIPSFSFLSLLGVLCLFLFRLAKKLKEQRREMALILDSVEEGVVVVDKNLKIQAINPIGAKFLKVSKKCLLSKPFPVLEEGTHAPFLLKCSQLLKICQETNIILTDSIILDGKKRLHIDLMARAKKEGAVLILQDKSRHHKILEMGRDFIANASHELRTPITIIKGFIETLQDFPELPREMVADITEKIARNCQRMDTLVKNLLTLADLENLPESRFQECDLMTLIEQCRQVVLAIYPDATIELEGPEESVNVPADPDILELAIINILNNAAKYSNPPAQINMRVKVKAEEVEMMISDCGIGIPPADLEHIFERFYTVDKARSRRFGGTGLGLSIVKTVIEKHQGTILVSSELGKGSRFVIELPFYRS